MSTEDPEGVPEPTGSVARGGGPRRPTPPRPPGDPAEGLASVLAALESSRAAVNSTRAAAEDTREAVARTRQAIAQSVAELRRAAELSARESAGERLSRAESRTLTRERLLDAAAEVFNRLGYHGASLEAVAEAAGYTKGAVYSNFATKGDLFIALHRRYTARRMADQSAAMASLSLEQLADQGGAILVEQARTQESWDLLQLEFWLAAMRDPELRAAMARDNDELWAPMGAAFEEKLAGGSSTPPFSGIEFAKLVSALGSGLILQLYIDPDFIDPAVFSRAVRVLAGMPREPDASPDVSPDAPAAGA